MTMPDPSQVFNLAWKGWEIVDKGLKHKSTAENFLSTVKALRPILQRMEQHAETMGYPHQKENIKRIRTELQRACQYTNIGWLNFFLAPYYHDKLVKAENSIKQSIQFWMTVQMWTKQTQNETNHIGDPESTVQLNAPLMDKLKSYLMRDGGDRIFHLHGFAGSGKTTLAEQLRNDGDVQGRFNYNILIKYVGSKIESNGDLAMQLINELPKNKRKAVLLVLDNVKLGSEQLVQQCRNQLLLNPKSKILVTSIDELSLGTTDPEAHAMEALDEDDATKLLGHFVQSGGDPRTLKKVVSCCGRYPIEIKLIGPQLRGKPIQYWQKKLKQWSGQGDSSHDTSTALLSRLQASLSVSEDFQRISKFFMDLGLFPKDERIPVCALIDMWVELYEEDEEGIDAMIHIDDFITMNLAELEVDRIVGMNDDNYYNDYFLKQHEVLRELAIHMSEEPIIENRRRLIIDMKGNHRPQRWLGNNQLNVAATILSISTDQNITLDWCNIQESGAVLVLVLNLVTKEYYTLPEFIKNMEDLKVLIVTNYGSPFAELRNLEVLDSLHRLKRIRLQDVSIPSLCNLMNVHKLSFSSCEVKKAFEDRSIEFSKAMPNLAVLDIDGCKDFEKFPDGFCDIVTLKKLNITSCDKFTEISKEIGKLENLELLWITYCPVFKVMPVSITKLKSLSSLNISYCESLRKLPDNIGELTSLKKLYMESCHPELRLPASVIDMENLEIYPLEGIQAVSVLD